MLLRAFGRFWPLKNPQKILKPPAAAPAHIPPPFLYYIRELFDRSEPPARTTVAPSESPFSGTFSCQISSEARYLLPFLLCLSSAPLLFGGIGLSSSSLLDHWCWLLCRERVSTGCRTPLLMTLRRPGLLGKSWLCLSCSAKTVRGAVGWRARSA